MSSKPAPIVTPIMRMGCTNDTITYRGVGFETVCLQSADHGVQQLANFNPAIGDVIGLDDILEKTLAKTDLSDIGKYVTSSVSAAGTTLYFDPTGAGKVGSAFAVLQGVTTSVAALVANGGIAYIPDQVEISTTFNTPLTLRSCGLVTVDVMHTVPGGPLQELKGFDPTLSDKIELARILNTTLASPTLSDVSHYITATIVNGNTVLSVDPTGAGQTGTAFAQLDGVHVTVSQLLADHALSYTPTACMAGVTAGMAFIFRSAGNETANVTPGDVKMGAVQLNGFSVDQGDGVGVGSLLKAAGIAADITNISHYISAVADGASTDLYFDKTGSGHGGVQFAQLHNVSNTMASLLSHNAFHFNT